MIDNRESGAVLFFGADEAHAEIELGIEVLDGATMRNPYCAVARNPYCSLKPNARGATIVMAV